MAHPDPNPTLPASRISEVHDARYLTLRWHARSLGRVLNRTLFVAMPFIAVRGFALALIATNVTILIPSRLASQTVASDSTRPRARDSLAVSQLTRVSGAALRAAPAFTLEQALQGKLSSVVVSMNDGAPWSDGQIQVRGVSTVGGDPSPLIVVDGVITSNTFLARSYELGGSSQQSLSAPSSARRREFTPFEIESVEVLKGPVATSRYGSRGASGVLLITTRRGASGPLRWEVLQRAGQLSATRLPTPRCQASVAEVIAERPPYAQLAASAAAANGGVLACRDHIRRYFSAVPIGFESALQASGGVGGTRFMASAARASTPAAIDGSSMVRSNLRLNLDQRVTDRLSAQLSAGYAPSAIRPAFGSETALRELYAVPSWIPLGPDVPQAVISPTLPDPFRQLALGRQEQTTDRATGGVLVAYEAVRRSSGSLRITYRAGTDRYDFRDSSAALSDTVRFPTSSFGPVVKSTAFATTGSAVTNHEFRLSGAAQVRQLGAVTFDAGYARDRQSLTRKTAVNFNDNPLSVSTSELLLKSRSAALFASSSLLASRERLELTASVRRDAFDGAVTGLTATYPSVGAAWRFSLPAGRGVVTPRIAWGRSGGLGLYGFSPFDLGSAPPLGVLPAPVRNVLERRTEGELGIDAVLWHGRVATSLTRFSALSDQLGVLTGVPSSGDGSSLFTPDAVTLESSGYDVAVRAVLIRGARLQWVSSINLSRAVARTSRFEAQSGGLTGTRYGPGRDHLLPVGEPATGISSFNPTALIDAAPRFDASFQNSVTIGGVSLSAQVDWRAGGNLFSTTSYRRDLFRTSPDFANPSAVPGQTLGESRLTGLFTADARTRYLTTAGSVRIRELVLRYAVPARVTRRLLNAGSLGISLQARNLAMWTTSVALDPEFSALGTTPVARYVDNALHPLLRQIYIGVDLAR
jgi:TonB-dependent starch-binding outer membrane protein SusC